MSLGQAVALLEQTSARGIDTQSLLATCQQHQTLARRYVDAYRRYCWPVRSITDLKLAPFHVLATQGETHLAKDHVWHMETLAEICRADEQLLLATPYLVIDLTDADSLAQGIQWWERLTGQGGACNIVILACRDVIDHVSTSLIARIIFPRSFVNVHYL
ncbi:MAG TPA: hypothetical protein VFB60_14475 [Ktedonobacteraceae bacterium]|nr:hypothetical protein [Ktedonobacteraceae bacterium]